MTVRSSNVGSYKYDSHFPRSYYKKRSPVPATPFYEKNYVLEKQLIIFGRNLAYQCKVYEKV